MKNNDPNIEDLLSSQGINDFFTRLTIAIQSKPLDRLSKHTNISKNTLYQYLNKSSFPDIPRLASIAKETHYSVPWLLFENISTNDIQQTITWKMIQVIDDIMKPTIDLLQCVLFAPITSHDNNKFISDGLYVISIDGKSIVRRIQWQHKDNCYLVFGDNPKYKPQLIKNIQIMGRVISTVTPI